MIYLDNAATTELDAKVFEKMLPYLKQNYGNAQSQHAAGRVCANAVLAARDKIAGCAGCLPEEVYFVSGGTEACNTALKGVCAAHKRGRIVVSAIEHPAVSESAEDMKKFGFEVVTVYPDAEGVVTVESVKKALTDDTIFCAVMAANNETGVIQPVEEIGKACRERGVFYFADCVQSAAYLPMPSAYADGMGFSAHKFYGPKGAGALILKKGSKAVRLLSGGMQERSFRGGTVNTAGIVGTAEAFAAACGQRERISRFVGALRDKFLSIVLKEIKGARLNGSLKNMLPSIANIAFDGCDGEKILFLLDMDGVCVSTGSACSAGAVAPSKTLVATGCDLGRAKSSVRFSFGKHNTENEVYEAVAALKSAIEKIRKG